MKIVTATVSLFLALSSTFVYAQVALAPIQNGSQLHYNAIVYGERGRDMYVEKQDPIKATFTRQANSDGYSLSFTSLGRVEEYSESHSVISFTSGGKTNKYEGPQVFDWLSLSKKTSLGIYDGSQIYDWSSKAFSLGKVGVTSYTLGSANCGQLRREFNDNTVSEKMFNVKIKGVDTALKTYHFTMNGKWSGSCGSGKFIHEISYSPELDIVIEYKSLNFLPNGFLFVGNNRVLTSIE